MMNKKIYQGFVELVPDLVWMIVKKQTTEASSELPESHHLDPILQHSQPKFPKKFLKPPSSPHSIPLEEVSIVWTAAIVTTIHFMFEFVIIKREYSKWLERNQNLRVLAFLLTYKLN